MNELPESKKDEIIKALEARGANRPCPRCGTNAFVLVGGYFQHTLQFELSGLQLGGTTIPTVAVVCSKCGYLAEHAVGGLGLLPGTGGKK
jgi:ribosomal protein S27AE